MLFSGASRISDCLSFGSLRHVVAMSAGEGGRVEAQTEAKEVDKKKGHDNGVRETSH